ncbi:hypothetical protein ACR3EC_09940, partial [Corynebacterium diphtheriae]
MSASEFTLVPTTESDRTYIARLNFLTDVFGDEHADIGADFLEDYRFYVKQWDPTNGGLIAWSPKMIPAGGAWLVWGNNNDHGYGGGFNWLSQHPEHGGVRRWLPRTGVRRPVICRWGCGVSGVRIG